MINKILFVGAHPDDIELGCAGTILKLRKEGKLVYQLIMTNGENWENKTYNIRLEEQYEASKLLDVEKVIFGDFEDGNITSTSKTIDFIVKIIKKYNIDTIMTHYPEDTHQDHVEIYKAVKVASNICKNFFTYESLTSKGFIPNCYIEITEFEERKQIIINCFRSQIKKYNQRKQNLNELTFCKDRINGMKIKTRIAEGLRAEKIEI